MLVRLVLIGALLALPAVAQEARLSFRGMATAIDGDTVKIDGHRVRIYGIDAPARGEPGFEEAAAFMRVVTESGPFVCGVVDKDQDDGHIAICFVVSEGQVEYVGRKLLKQGLVKTYRKHRHLAPEQFDSNEATEAWAKEQCQGLWRELPECQ